MNVLEDGKTSNEVCKNLYPTDSGVHSAHGIMTPSYSYAAQEPNASISQPIIVARATSGQDSIIHETNIKVANSSLLTDNDNAEAAIPELIRLIKDENDPVILNQVAIMLFQLSKTEALTSLRTEKDLLMCIVHCIESSCDFETIRYMVGTLYNISQHADGLKAIFESNCVGALVNLLTSPVEAILFYSITTLHNLLLYQEVAKEVVRKNDGVRKMVHLLTKHNIKFLAICTDCLQILGYSHPPSKAVMYECGAPMLLVNILNSFHYEKLLWTTTRVLKILSVCPKNKLAIIKCGGIAALYRHLLPALNISQTTSSPAISMESGGEATLSNQMYVSHRLVHNCLWTLRNLSDSATQLQNMEAICRCLIQILIMFNANRPLHITDLLCEKQPTDLIVIATCAAGVLSNLTCNNEKNKMFIVQIGGIEVLLTVVWCLSHNMSSNVLENNNKSDLLEACLCALRHLTSKHSLAATAQKACVRYPIGNLPSGVLVLLRSLEMNFETCESSINLPILKANVGLIRNIVQSGDNFALLRDHGIVPCIIRLLSFVEKCISRGDCVGTGFSGRDNHRHSMMGMPSSQQDVNLEEIIELTCVTLHSIAKYDIYARKALIQTLPVILRFLLSEFQSIQLGAVCILAELVKDSEGLQSLSIAPVDVRDRIFALCQSPREDISTYASVIHMRLQEKESFNENYSACSGYTGFPHPEAMVATYRPRDNENERHGMSFSMSINTSSSFGNSKDSVACNADIGTGTAVHQQLSFSAMLSSPALEDNCEPSSALMVDCYPPLQQPTQFLSPSSWTEPNTALEPIPGPGLNAFPASVLTSGYVSPCNMPTSLYQSPIKTKRK